MGTQAGYSCNQRQLGTSFFHFTPFNFFFFFRDRLLLHRPLAFNRPSSVALASRALGFHVCMSYLTTLVIFRTELNRTFPCDPAIAPLRSRSLGLKTNVHIKTCLQAFIAALFIPLYTVSNQTQSDNTYEQHNAIQGANRRQKDTKGASVWNLEQMKPVWKVWSLCDPNRRTAKKSPYMERKMSSWVRAQGVGEGRASGLGTREHPGWGHYYTWLCHDEKW